jgi:transposase InsO family protein
MHHTATPKTRESSPPRDPTARLLFSDWWGPYNILGPNKERFIQVFIDDASGYVWTFPSASQDCGASNLQAVEADLREKFGVTSAIQVSAVNSDFATVYTDGKFAAWCKKRGILQRFSAPYSQALNGKAERFWRTMETSITAAFAYSETNYRFWPYALSAFTAHFNATSPSSAATTPHELLLSSKPDISFMKVWGCPVQAFLEKSEHHKFTPKCRPGINLGPNIRCKGS